MYIRNKNTLTRKTICIFRRRLSLRFREKLIFCFHTELKIQSRGTLYYQRNIVYEFPQIFWGCFLFFNIYYLIKCQMFVNVIYPQEVPSKCPFIWWNQTIKIVLLHNRCALVDWISCYVYYFHLWNIWVIVILPLLSWCFDQPPPYWYENSMKLYCYIVWIIHII